MPILTVIGNIKNKNMKTKDVVIFRKFKDGEILALFPYMNEGDYEVNSYMHLGQHCCADYTHCIQTTSPANESEYEELKQELTSIGYDLDIRKRACKRLMYK